MAESVPVRCPSCRREHRFTAPSYPCVCGAPVAPRLDRDGTVTPVTHRVWQDDWVTVRCESCGRHGEWPRPEAGCPCGVVLRVPVTEGRGVADRGGRPGQDMAAEEGLGAGGATGQDTTADDDLRPSGATRQDTTADDDLRPSGATRQDTTADDDLGADRDIAVDADAEAARDAAPGPGSETGPRDAAATAGRAAASALTEGTPASADTDAGAGHSTGADVGAGAGADRPPFRSVTIRTALDAVTAAALYLRWLGYRGVRRADQRPPSGIGLAARGVVALVDPAMRPATLRDVECLWLTAMTESADCLYFSLAGYADDARARADALGIPLFVLDLTGTPRPVNAPAGALDAAGTGNRAP